MGGESAVAGCVVVVVVDDHSCDTTTRFQFAATHLTFTPISAVVAAAVVVAAAAQVKRQTTKADGSSGR